jgi:hypothetical protein
MLINFDTCELDISWISGTAPSPNDFAAVRESHLIELEFGTQLDHILSRLSASPAMEYCGRLSRWDFIRKEKLLNVVVALIPHPALLVT